MRISKEEALEYLSEAKNYWNAIHVIADAAAKNTTAGRVYLFMQATAGGAIIDTANGDTLDVQLVGIAGDLVGGAILVRNKGDRLLLGTKGTGCFYASFSSSLVECR